MRVFRNDNGFDTVCRREAKTRAAADTAYSETMPEDGFTEKTSCRATARFLYYHLILYRFYTESFLRDHGKRKKRASVGHP